LDSHDLTVLPSPHGLHPALDHGAGDVAAALAAAAQPAAAASALAEAARRLAASAAGWRPLLGAAPGATRLAWRAGLELWLVEWAPGAATRVHDHGGAAVALTVLDGALVEDCLDATIWTTCRRTTFRAGTTVAFAPGHVHRLAAEPRRPAASVHAWSRSLPARPPAGAGTGTAGRGGSS
jgi:hypothetical protein